MTKNTLPLAVFGLFTTGSLLATSAHADTFTVDPTRSISRCEDAPFRNETYIQQGPPQDFVFTTTDGDVRHVNFRTHQDCQAKLEFIKAAQLDDAHPWVQIETSPMSFAKIDAPVAKVDREISSMRTHTK